VWRLFLPKILLYSLNMFWFGYVSSKNYYVALILNINEKTGTVIIHTAHSLRWRDKLVFTRFQQILLKPLWHWWHMIFVCSTWLTNFHAWSYEVTDTAIHLGIFWRFWIFACTFNFPDIMLFWHSFSESVKGNPAKNYYFSYNLAWHHTIIIISLE